MTSGSLFSKTDDFQDRCSLLYPMSYRRNFDEPDSNRLPRSNCATAQARIAERGNRTRLRDIFRSPKRAAPCRMMCASWESNPRCHAQGSNLRSTNALVHAASPEARLDFVVVSAVGHARRSWSLASFSLRSGAHVLKYAALRCSRKPRQNQAWRAGVWRRMREWPNPKTTKAAWADPAAFAKNSKNPPIFA
jgi:hypothetical protein